MINAQEVFERMSEGLSSPISHRILEVAKDERAWAQSFAEVIGSDRLFSVRFLFLAGSVNGLPRRLNTVSQAVTALGFPAVKALALGLTLYDFDVIEPEEMSGEGGRLRDLWDHSLACALIASRVGAADGVSPLPMAFVAGFLHDAGRVLCYRHFREEFHAALKLAATEGISLTEAESRIFGADHCVAGEVWARHADLPLLIRQTIQYHHTPLAAVPPDADPLLKKTLACIRIADHFGAGTGARLEILENGQPLAEEWALLSQSEEGSLQTVKRIQREVMGVREMFGFVEPPPDASAPALFQAAGKAKGRLIQFPGPGRVRGRAPGKVSGKKLTILVVEDHGSLLEVLGLYFMRSGYHVRTAGDGESALAILAKEEVHLLVLDLLLPGIDGFGLLRRLKGVAREQRPYIIVISAGAAEGDKKKVLELGADEYVPKPFHLSCLLEKIQTVERQLA